MVQRRAASSEKGLLVTEETYLSTTDAVGWNSLELRRANDHLT